MTHDEPTYLTRQEALQQAHTEARRDLAVTETAIRYVAFEPSFQDWCRIEFVREAKGWVRTLTSLPAEERLPEERVTDAEIVAAARENRMLAIRLYRARYGVGLAEAVEGIERMPNGK